MSQCAEIRVRLFVGGLDANVKAHELRRLFESFGSVTDVSLALDAERRCRGCVQDVVCVLDCDHAVDDMCDVFVHVNVCACECVCM